MGEGLSSSEFNNNMSNIELRLNIIYQKIKYLQELTEYTKNYVDYKIKSKHDEFKEKLKIISEVTDVYRDTNSISQLIYLTPCNDKVIDRDGTELPLMNISDKSLVPPGNNTHTATINSIISKSSSLKYSCNYDNLKNNECGHAVYISDDIILNGLNDDITIQFNNASSINYIDIPVINGEIVKYEIVYDNGSKKEVTPNDKYIDEAAIKEISIRINSKNYTKIKQATSKESLSGILNSRKNEETQDIMQEQNNLIKHANESEIS